MPTRRWTARYKGHEITLNNHWSYVPGMGKGEWLEVDGEPFISGKASWVDTTACLSGSITLSGKQVNLEGLIGWDGIVLRGQIRIDGAIVGGDASMGGLERSVLEKVVGRGALHFMIVHGLARYGLSFGLSMAAIAYIQAGTGPMTLLKILIITGGFYGSFMGIVFYAIPRRALIKLYRVDGR